MHMLSTEIHLRKWKHVLTLAFFHLLQTDFQPAFRLLFPLFTDRRVSYSPFRYGQFTGAFYGPLYARQNTERLTREVRLTWRGSPTGRHCARGRTLWLRALATAELVWK